MWWFSAYLCVRYVYIININTVTAELLKSQNGNLFFSTCEDGVVWHMIPRRISPCSESFLEHVGTDIMWGLIWG